MGFTLIELSIVLVIIGLVVSGVLVGRDLIKTAEIRKVISQQQSVSTAISTFRAKYNTVPGDATNIVDYFSDGIPGNNNGLIEALECYNLWHHLGSAKLVQGRYLPYSVAPIPGNIVTWAYKLEVRKTYLTMCTLADPSANYWLWDRENAFIISTNSYPLDGGVVMLGWLGGLAGTGDIGLSPQEAYYFDTKLDDAKPLSGNVKTAQFGLASSLYCDNNTSNEYNLAASYNNCALRINVK